MKCKTCHVEKDVDAFYAHPGCKNGRLPHCKSCVLAQKKWMTPDAVKKKAIYDIKYRDERRGKLNADRRARYQRQISDPNERQRLWQKFYNIRRRDKIKYRARGLLEYAVKAGNIKKLPCFKCGNPDSEGHHEDYNRPLDVIWACHNHHIWCFHRKYQTTSSGS